MYDYNAPFWGMHLFWWLFWAVCWVSFFSFLTPIPRRRWSELRETPQQILLRRLASGEITEEEYGRRKALVDRDGRTEAARDRATGSRVPSPT